jgi:hypothetical protein
VALTSVTAAGALTDNARGVPQHSYTARTDRRPQDSAVISAEVALSLHGKPGCSTVAARLRRVDRRASTG